MFDLNKDGTLQATGIVTVLAIFCDGSDEEKSELLFRIWDSNDDGKITKQDIKEHTRALGKNSIVGNAVSLRVSQ